MNEERENDKDRAGYYSIIPSKILYNKELKSNEKLLYAMIASLACKEGYCFATNNYFAKALDVHPKTVSSWISDLRDKNYIKVEMVRKENKQIIQRKIYINDVPYPLNNGYRYQSKNVQPIYQNVEDNNIRFNNKINNKGQKNLYQITKIRENILKNFLKVCMLIVIYLFKNKKNILTVG